MFQSRPNVERLAALTLVAMLLAMSGSRADGERPAWGETFPLQADEESRPYDARVSAPPPSRTRHLIEHSTLVEREQVDPLHSVIRIEFDRLNVLTVGDAASVLLKPIGYELLARGPNTSELLPALLNAPLPDMQRSFRNVRVSEVLRALGGVGYMPVVDHVRRRVTFDPTPRYNHLGGTGEADTPWAELPESESRGRAAPIVPALPMSAPGGDVASARPVPLPGADQDGWQVVEGAEMPTPPDEPADFRARVQAVLNGPTGREEGRVSAPTVLEVVIVNRPDLERLPLATELALRRVADAFDAGGDTVTIASCEAGPDAAAPGADAERHRLDAALERLGITRAYVRDAVHRCGGESEMKVGTRRLVLERRPTQSVANARSDR